MSESKQAQHTPGPWHAQECYVPTPTETGYENGDRYMPAIVFTGDPEDERGVMEGSVICEMRDMPAAEQNANAHLIAAAPEMARQRDQLLGVCESMAALVDDAESIAYPLKIRFRKACGAAVTAIASAKGEGS